MVTRRLLVLSGDKVTNKRAKRKKERKLFFFLFRVPVTSAKPKLRISERKAKEMLAFLSLFRAEVTYLKLRKIESRTKRTCSFFMPRWSNLSKVTNQIHYEMIFSPMMDAISVVRKNSRQNVAGSLKMNMPTSTAPTAPIPVQAGYAVPIGSVWVALANNTALNT